MKWINTVNVKDIDLNLLVVFDAVMRTRSLTAAGQQLGQAQPTISHALGRLRQICGDQLFVRAHRGIEPTPYALQLADPVANALDLLNAGLSKPARFDPATARTTFTLLMSDVGQTILLPRLVRRAMAEAPNICIVAAHVERDGYAGLLQTGKADIAIGALPHLRAGFFQQKLFQDRYVCVVCEKHLTIGSSISMEDYLAGKHVGIMSSGFSDVELNRALSLKGRSRRLAVKVPHFLAAPALVPDTELIVTVPSRVLGALPDRRGIKVVELEAKTPALAVHQYWHERSHDDDASRWLRGIVAETFAESSQKTNPIRSR
jgi:DNA-binding transcriptional LysR family regulator